MTDREKVMKGLSLCKWSNAGLYEGFLPEYEVCNKCPYARNDFEVDECCAELMRDALELLKAKETTLEKDGHHIRCLNCGEYWCDNDREGNPFSMNFCPNCGQAVKRNDHD